VIVNPHAKENRCNPERVQRLAGIVGGHGSVVETLRSETLDSVFSGVARNGCEMIGICGGDGTIHLCVTALVKAYRETGCRPPPVLFMRGGSMNTVCKNLEVKGSAERTVQMAVARLAAGSPVATFPQRLLDVNGRQGFLFGNGYASNFLKEYYGSGLSPGPMRAVKVVAQAMGSTAIGGAMSKRIKARMDAGVEIDGVRAPFGAFGMMMAGTVCSVGAGFRPLYRAREKPGYFHFVGTGMQPNDILWQLDSFYSGRPMRHEHHIDTLAMMVRVSGTSPLAYILDGELYEDAEISIRCGQVLDVVLLP
jgi:diacylglycerol kinase family enzyme